MSGGWGVGFRPPSPQTTTTAPNTTKPIYVRADGRAAYAIVAQVMASLSTNGFTSINLITDTGGPSSGGKPDQTPYQGPVEPARP